MVNAVISESNRNQKGLLLVTEIFDSSILNHSAAWAGRLDDYTGKRRHIEIDDRPRYKFKSEYPRTTQEQLLQVKLFDLAAESVKSDLESTRQSHFSNNRRDIIPDFENYSEYKKQQQKYRRSLLLDRMKQGVTNPEVLFKDLADPQMITRISQGVSAVEQFQVLTPGVRPFTELRKQQLALKYLDFCEKRDKYAYVNRFKKSYETCLKMN